MAASATWAVLKHLFTSDVPYSSIRKREVDLPASIISYPQLSHTYCNWTTDILYVYKQPCAAGDWAHTVPPVPLLISCPGRAQSVHLLYLLSFSPRSERFYYGWTDDRHRPHLSSFKLEIRYRICSFITPDRAIFTGPGIGGKIKSATGRFCVWFSQCF